MVFGFMGIAVLAIGFVSPPVEIEESRDVAYGLDVAQRLDVYRAKGATGTRPAVLWIHGGGWTEGDKRASPNGISTLAPQLVASGYVAVACNYRLLPAHRFPAQVDDVRKAVGWLRAHAKEYGIDPARIGVVGISAGGHLACMLAVLGDDSGAAVQAAVSLNGVTDLRASAPSTPPLTHLFDTMLGNNPKKRAEASPVTLVRQDSAPTLLVVGAADNLVPPAQSTLMAEALREAGATQQLVTIPGAGHGIFPSITPEARDATLRFFRTFLKP